MTTVSSTSSTSAYTSSTSSTSASSSTVDWDALVEGMVQAKLDKADTIDAKVTANQTKISSYQELQTQLQDVADKAKALSNPSGTSNASADVFATRSAYLTNVGDVDASSVVSVDVDAETQLGTYSLVIEQIAKANKISSGTVSSRSDALNYDGVFSIGLEDAGTEEISVSSGMSLSDIADAINNKSSSTGIQATILQVADGEFQILLTATSTGKAISAGSVSGADVLNELGITDASGGFSNEVQAAQKAIIKLDGVTITRDNNDISDVLDGVSFHLYTTTPAETSVSVQVAQNLSSIQTAIQDFVDSYNTLRDYIISQSKTSTDGTADSAAVLFGDQTLRSVARQLENDLSLSVLEYSLSSLGITFDSDNKLEIDTSTLANALNNNLEDVQKLFEFNIETSSTKLRLLARGSNAPTSFTLDVQVDGSGTITSASVGGDASLFEIKGTRIVGKSGSAFDGFSFSYAGTTSETIDISLSYGLAERVYFDSDAVGNVTSGTLKTIIDNIEEQDTDLTDRSNLIRSQAETYRTQLTSRYAKIQEQILKANSTISYLKILNSSDSSD